MLIDFIGEIYKKQVKQKQNRMKKKEFNSLFLNMLDILEITMKDFYYKITEENGQKIVDCGYNKSAEEGWILCNNIYGQYCGTNYQSSGELNRIKIRVFHPFKMNKNYKSYLSLDPSFIVSIVCVLKQKTSAMDRMRHKIMIALSEKTENI